MADRPILFSAPMVRALLDGRKTQTRRILKPQPYSNGFHFDGRDILCHCDELPPATLLMERGKGTKRYTVSDLEDGPEGFAGVYVGDRLWVREAWRTYSMLNDAPAREIGGMRLWYCADDGYQPQSRVRSPIHMPRIASRLTLSVTDVRVQRIQDISEEDAEAEGYPSPEQRAKSGVAEIRDSYPIAWYSWLWDSINGAGSWQANPWVVAYTFTVEHRNINARAADALRRA